MQLWAHRQPIILVRKQFQQLLRQSNKHEPLRNQLIIDLPSLMGLRRDEFRLARREDIDIDAGHLYIRNSKSKHLYPIPMPYTIAQKLECYCQKQTQGYILQRLLGASYTYKKHDRPIGKTLIRNTWHRVAIRAGLQHPELYTPRLGRHYFAAMWDLKGGNLETLRRILRHTSLEYTKIYLSRLIFAEDVKREFDRIHEIPQIGGDVPRLYPETETVQLREECLSCPALRVCKYKEYFARDEAASGCRFRKLIMEKAKT